MKSNNKKAEYTPFTIKQGGQVSLREDRPALLISSTSWTPDEDFSILLDAMVLYDEMATKMEKDKAGRKPPKITLVITGNITT
jgi:beta-1,4-mannosyltransferase